MRVTSFRTFLVGLTLAVLMLSANLVASTSLVNTGSAGTSSIGSWSLFAAGATNCSPQPACGAHFQYLAAQFTLSHAAALDSAAGWMSFGFGGSMAVKIYTDNNGLPGTAIYSQTYAVSNVPFSWVNFANYNVSLPAGTFWLAFEPVTGSNMNGGMSNGAPSPLAKYAYYSDGNPGYLTLAGASLGIQISGTLYPDLSFGTATRTILAGSVFGFPFDTGDVILGDANQPETSAWYFVIPAGWSYANGRLLPNTLSAGAYSATSGGCAASFSGCTSAAGLGRGVAFRSFVNSTAQTVTLRVNAVLHGQYGNIGVGTATAGIYVFDPTGFSTALAAGPNAGQFLLSRDSLADFAAPSSSLSLASLFPAAAVLANNFQVVVTQPGVNVSIPISSDLVTLAPQQSMTVMFDVGAYARDAGSANFASTLVAAANLFTDANGNPVSGIVGTGPAGAAPRTPTTVSLTPSTETNAAGSAASITATVTAADNTPVADTLVFFNIASGPNAGITGPMVTDANGQAVFTYTDNGGPGTDTIQASAGTVQSNSVQKVWTSPGALDHIKISPASATIASAGNQAYTAEGFDKFGNSRGDVTADTTFSIAPDGSCTAAVCTATTAGTHTVTGNDAGKTATATLNVTQTGGLTFQGFFQPIDMSTSTTVVWNTVKGGQAVPVKWRLTSNGVAVSDPASFAGVISYPVACTSGTGSIDDAIEQIATGNSSLAYLGDGNWQFNWQTSSSYKNTCRVMVVKFADGTTSPGANFKFK